MSVRDYGFARLVVFAYLGSDRWLTSQKIKVSVNIKEHADVVFWLHAFLCSHKRHFDILARLEIEFVFIPSAKTSSGANMFYNSTFREI